MYADISTDTEIDTDTSDLHKNVSNIISEGQKKRKVFDLTEHLNSVVNNSTNDLRNNHITQNLQEQDIPSIQNHSKESEPIENHQR